MCEYKVWLGQLTEVRKHMRGLGWLQYMYLMVQRFRPVQTGSPSSGPPPDPEPDFGSSSAPMLNFGLDLGPVH